MKAQLACGQVVHVCCFSLVYYDDDDCERTPWDNIYIYGKVYEKRDLAFIIKKYNKNALRLICYNFRTVNATNFLFSTLHTAPFLYGKIHFGILHLLRVSIATFDTPLGSNPP